MRIRRIRVQKRRFLALLLVGDEDERMVERYLDRGTLYVLYKAGRPCAVAVVTDEGEGVLELKNLAVAPALQRHGLGRFLIGFLERRYRGSFHTLLAGTGESEATLGFYRRLGFVYSHRVQDFFTLNYPHPIVEGGTVLRDMVYLKKILICKTPRRRGFQRSVP